MQDLSFEKRLQRIAGQTQQIISSGMEEEAREHLLEADSLYRINWPYDMANRSYYKYNLLVM